MIESAMKRNPEKETPETLALVQEFLSYDPETGELTWKKRRAQCVRVGDPAGNTQSRGYRQVMLDGRTHYAHRVAFALHHGRWPEGELDHVNGERADNRADNLRECTASQNCIARGGNGKAARSCGRNIRPCASRFQVFGTVDGKPKYLASFGTAEGARAFRDAWELVNHGAFAAGGAA